MERIVLYCLFDRLGERPDDLSLALSQELHLAADSC